MQNQYKSPEDVYLFLESRQASKRLIKHHKLVVEAAEEIIAGLKHNFPNLDCNYQQVLIGSAIHDAGKIIFPDEISSSGSNHELQGEKYLITLGISPDIARFCRTHSHWNDPDNTFEDLLVALADNLWKGCRKEELEHLAIAKIACLTKQNFWDIFIIADSLLEKVSDRSTDRLNRSW